MLYIIFFSFLIFFGQRAQEGVVYQSQSTDILLATLICPIEEKAIISEKFYDTDLNVKREIKCSNIILDNEVMDGVLKNVLAVSSCKINFLKNNQSVSLVIQFDPRVVKIHMEKGENKEGDLVIMCYFYDKKIIDMLEICTKKSILQYTFNRSFSLFSLCVKT